MRVEAIDNRYKIFTEREVKNIAAFNKYDEIDVDIKDDAYA